MFPSSSAQPDLPVPTPIRSDVPGTWAYDTVASRLPNTARRTLIENDFPPEIVAAVTALVHAVPQEPIRSLQQEAPDAAAWAVYTVPHLGQNWLAPPWFFAETYFYRRLLEATGYFGPGPGHHLDPFVYQKQQGLLTTLDTTKQIAHLLSESIARGWQEQDCANLLAIDLWGNRADLSLWPADETGDHPQAMDWNTAAGHTLADDTAVAVRHLSERRPARLDFLIDNAGVELVADLALADYLLAAGAARTVVFHLKPHPTFVSDAMSSDVSATVTFLAGQRDAATAEFGQRLQDYLTAGRLQLLADSFWVSPLAFWEAPPALRAILGRSDLIISKGDANYRRLLGDRQWPYTTPFTAIMTYTPAPLLALRALKSELAAGITGDQIERLNVEDPTWLVNGRWGVIQFAVPGAQT